MANHKEPDLPQGFLGQQSKFREFKLGVLSHVDNKIKLKECDGNELCIKLGYTDPVKTTFSLIEANTKEDRSECAFAQTHPDEHIISYNITIPATGYWKFQIFALPASDPSKSLSCVLNYLIHCVRVKKPAHACPTQFCDWKDGCVLIEPMVLHRDVTGPTVNFRLKIPDAKKVAVVVEQVWTHLMQNSDGEWCGAVFVGKHYGMNASVTVNALFGEEGCSYGTLLEYII